MRITNIYVVCFILSMSDACFGGYCDTTPIAQLYRTTSADYAKIRDMYDAIKELVPGTPDYSAACANIGNMYRFVLQKIDNRDEDDQAEAESATDTEFHSLETLGAKLKIVVTYAAQALYTAAADITAQVALHEPTQAELQSMQTEASEIAESLTRLGQDASQVLALVQQIVSILNGMGQKL
jgi:hypothetical protein